MENAFRKKDLEGRNYFSQDFDNYYYTAGTEDDYDRIDVYATAKTQLERTYAIEIKCYNDPEHPRPYEKYENYQIDYEKLDTLCAVAESTGRIPILYVRFSDWTVVWDLTKIDWKSRLTTRLVNKNGQAYGREKEWSRQTYLYLEEAAWKKRTS